MIVMQISVDEDKVYSASEVSGILNRNIETVYRAIRKGELVADKISNERDYEINGSDLICYIRSHVLKIPKEAKNERITNL